MLVDKHLFITMLRQLKATALVKVSQNYLFKTNYVTNLASQSHENIELDKNCPLTFLHGSVDFDSLY